MGASVSALSRVGGAAATADRASLLRAIDRKATLSQCLANTLGALDVCLLLFFVLPLPSCCTSWDATYLVPNIVVAAVYLPLAMLIGATFGRRFSPGNTAWAREGRAPTQEEQARALHAINWCFKLDIALWLGAAIVFFVVNAFESVPLAIHVAWTLALGGMTTAGIAYLLMERDWRPLTELALEGGLPARPAWPRIEGRLVLAWLLTSGVPLFGLATLGAQGLIDDIPSHQLARGVLALAVAGLAIGAGGTLAVARGVAGPLTAVRLALGRVQAGDLATHVRVSDGSEIGFLQSGFNSMVSGLRERERMQDLYARQVGEDVARAALADEPRLGGAEREIAALFVDVIGSTTMALEAPPERVVARLNRFFAVVVDVISAHGGWVNKFEGDAALCVFGAPVACEDTAGSALAAGRELQARLRREVPEVQAAIGLSAGKAVAGWIGAAQRYEYTVIGDPVNVASRLSELAKREDARLLASEAIVSRANPAEREHWELGEAEVLRGRTRPTRLARATAGVASRG